MSDPSLPQIVSELRAANEAVSGTRDALARLADDADGDRAEHKQAMPTPYEAADRLLKVTEAECRKLDRLVIRMEEAALDPGEIIKLLDMITSTAMSVRALRDSLPPGG